VDTTGDGEGGSARRRAMKMLRGPCILAVFAIVCGYCFLNAVCGCF